MFTICIAGVPVEIDNRYGHVQKYCEGWECDDAPEFRVRVSPSEISDYIAKCRMPMDEPTAERVLVYFKICARLSEYGAFLIHGAAVESGGHGVIFSAGRGVGKTTHIRLLQKRLGDRMHIVNGDKPLVRYEKGAYVAYGTPWRGKEGYGDNSATVIDRVCFLGRGGNTMRKVEPAEAAVRLQGQTVYPQSEIGKKMLAESLAGFLSSVKLCCAEVDMSEDAAGLTAKLFNASKK